jgi:3-phosphoshikimate 1-carboxyvinyltransferase
MSHYVVHPAPAPLAGRLRVPGDKSIGHRAILFGALSDGVVEVSGLSGGQDNARTRAAMSAMGVAIEDRGPGAVSVHGVGVDGLRAPVNLIDCGNSGTTMRLLCGLLSGQRFLTQLTGDSSLVRRPMRRVAAPLGRLGARIAGELRDERPGEIFAPLRIEPARGRAPLTLGGGVFELEIASAQVKSALLLAGLYADGEVRVTEPGPSRDHSERMLAHMGAPLKVDGRTATIDVRGWDRRLAAAPIAVPGDPSSSAFLVAAALVTGGRVEVDGVCLNPTRTGYLDALAAMGAPIGRERATVVGGEQTATLVVDGAAATLRGATVAGELVVRAIDEVPILAVIAARAAAVTDFRDCEELRVKESDRIATTCDMLRGLGVDVDERPDGFTVQGTAGRPFRACRINGHGDHRIAMAGAIAALAADGPCRIDDVDNVATSFPTFVELLRGLGATLELG